MEGILLRILWVFGRGMSYWPVYRGWPVYRWPVWEVSLYFKIGYLNRFGYLKKSVRLPKNRFGYLKIGFGYLKIDYKLKGKYVFLPFILQQQCFGLRYLNH